MLVAGNGGSAALAHHLTGELVGRYDREREPFSALALSGDTAALTAIGNDYGYDEVFARQVLAARPPGRRVRGAVDLGTQPQPAAGVWTPPGTVGLTAWAMTGPGPNPLADAADDAVAVPCPDTPSVQDVHQVAVHLLCLAFENAARRCDAAAPSRSQEP